MSFDVRDDYRYRETHEWIAPGEPQRVGITDFAQDELGDVVFVELPEVGDSVTAGEEFGVIESIKAVSDLYAPVSGEVVDINDRLFDEPELVNESPFDEGWMIEIDPDDADPESLLTPDEYREQTA